MSQEYTNQQLERMVLGKVEKPNVVFYDKSTMNPDLSRAAGKRVYQTVLMVKYTQPGVTDWTPKRVQKDDIAKNPEAYQYYLSTKGDVGSPSVDILPGINPDETQELIDYGIVTITKLCDAERLPAHLNHLQASARRLNEVLKHERNCNEKAHQEEGSQEGHHEATGQEVGSSIPEEVRQVPASDRPLDTVSVRQRELPSGVQDGSGEAGRRSGQGGRDNDCKSIELRKANGQYLGGTPKEVKPWCSPNWSITYG